jgi:hypothetical protein
VSRVDKLARELADVIRDTAYRDGLPTGVDGDVASVWIGAGARAAMTVLHERGWLWTPHLRRRGVLQRARWVERQVGAGGRRDSS